eukprot:GDKH01008583.1.p2 GENE.GDKH01008583.1~~GDKH01008583.1.p2  ORF type:complete len:67 (+),score=3.95 GDKH01008583.1:110-310(+)
MKRASRQILTALLLLSRSLFHRVLAHSPWGAVSARVVGGCYIVRVLFRPWETRRAILVGSRELCGR